MELQHVFDIPSLDEQREAFPFGIYRIIDVSDLKKTELTDKAKKAGTSQQEYYTITLEEYSDDPNFWGNSHSIKKAVMANTHSTYFTKIAKAKSNGTMAMIDNAKIPCRVGTINSKIPYEFPDPITGVIRTAYSHTLILFKDEPIMRGLSARVAQLEGSWKVSATDMGHFAGVVDPNVPLKAAAPVVAQTTEEFNQDELDMMTGTLGMELEAAKTALRAAKAKKK